MKLFRLCQAEVQLRYHGEQAVAHGDILLRDGGAQLGPTGGGVVQRELQIVGAVGRAAAVGQAALVGEARARKRGRAGGGHSSGRDPPDALIIDAISRTNAMVNNAFVIVESP